MKKTTLLFVSLIFGLLFQMQSQTLIAHWPLNGDTNDVTGNGRHLTTSGSNWEWLNDLTRGDVFQSKVQEGKKLYIDVDTSSPLNIKSNFTVCLWVKNDTGNGYLWHNVNSRFFAKNLQFQINGGHNTAQTTPTNGVTTRVRYGSANNALLPSPTSINFENGGWHHVSLTVTSDLLATLYINGTAMSSRQMSAVLDTDGSYIEIASAFGKFSDARIYNKALSPEEIAIVMTWDQTFLDIPVLGEGINITSNGFTANWSPVTNAVGYRVQVFQAENLIETYQVDADDTELQISGLAANTAYSYTVNALGDGITSYNSEVSDYKYVTTNLSTSNSAVPLVQSVRISYDKGAIICSQTGDVELYNIEGMRLFKTNAVDRIQVDLKPGLYLLIFSKDTENFSTKLLIY